MVRYLANENVPADAVEAARKVGFDMAWVRDRSPGLSDDAVSAMSLAEGRVLVAFDIAKGRPDPARADALTEVLYPPYNHGGGCVPSWRRLAHCPSGRQGLRVRSTPIPRRL